YLSASIGYALYPDDTTDFDKLISYADIAMFKSKTEKSNKCFRFNKEMYDNINNKVGVINDLKRAIEKDEFDVYFQEIVDVKSQEVAYIEALIRWHSNKGVIMPKDFIPIAEETGFIQTLDLIVINKALRYFKNIKLDKRYQNTKLTINVSPALLLNKNFPDNLNDLTHKLHIANDEVCIEINENTFVNNKEESRKQIKLLKDLGFLIALDDFGREYSSLSILNKVDFDIIKIDRLFIINLDLRLNVEIINMINKIAQLSDNIVIVEGVETEEQKEKLMNLGCYLMQGFLFSKPAKILVKEKVEV
ncbi:MAG TPA: GGDEF domain-containing phosphodiesterase, partial [Haloplasmataceae bacterium]